MQNIKSFFGFLLFVFFVIAANAQLTTNPLFPRDNSSITITFDATKGNKALMDYATPGDVYVHIGVITNLSTGPGDWKYSKFAWASTVAAAKATSLGNNKYSFAVASPRTFFGVPANETIQKIVLVFRNGTGSVVAKNDNGTDMFISIYPASGTYTKIAVPEMQNYFVPQPKQVGYNVGQTIAVTANASAAATLALTVNGVTNSTKASATTISSNINISSPGNYTIKALANNAVATADSFSFFVAAATQVQDMPTGARDGINYNADNTSATLVLHAPGKGKIIVVGDFNNWTPSLSYQMKKSTDGNKFWLTIPNLAPGVEYGFQYVVDDSIRVGDPYSEKILDPWNDQYINDVPGFTVYPNLKPYPVGKTTGYVSVLQTAKPAYNWTATNYTRPEQSKLLVYELHLRDFVGTHSWKTLKDTLNYLQNLGINAIELLPFNEFDGNDSWGYNPNFYTAPDKYYGTDVDLKAFIDECHKRGIAVIQDIVFNHAWGSCPLAALYYDNVNNRPAANNPWFNQFAPHPYGFGNDFNFSSGATKYFFQRVLEYWLTEYKIDGFRFDLSKGFTNKYTGGDVGAWGQYDAERVANIKWLADVIWSKTLGGYVILEHLGEWNEENEYMNYKQGMMPWHRLDIKYGEAVMGWPGCNQDISEVYYKHNNNFGRPLRMGNLESHDEERLAYKGISYGNANAGYTVKTLANTTKRMQAAAAFHLLVPGPKMIWQFTELGYDYSINACSNGNLGVGDACRTSRKPLKWDYLQNVDRLNLYKAIGAMMKLRNKYGNVFATDLAAGYDLGCNSFKNYQINHTEMNVTVVGNFDVVPQTKTINFQHTGTWTEYITGVTLNVGNTAQSITLQPGEYRIYLDKNVTAANIDAPQAVRSFPVYFKKPTNWSSAKVHIWNSVPTGAMAATTWPGNVMAQVCGDWYKFEFANIAATNLIFNDGGGNQTLDLTATDTAYYDNGWLATKPTMCPQATTDSIVVYFENTNNWAQPRAYCWSVVPSSYNSCVAWPGNAMTKVDGCGNWWKYVMYGATSSNIIFNNGSSGTGNQTADLSRTAGQWQYSNGAWTSGSPTCTTTGSITVYFENTGGWTQPKVYCWNATPTTTANCPVWPGTNMTKVAGCGNWWSYTFNGTTATNLIFNNGSGGSGNQSADLNLSGAGVYNYSWTSKVWNNGRPTCTAARGEQPSIAKNTAGISPNPMKVGESAVLAIGLQKAANLHFKLVDARGKTVASKSNVNVAAGFSKINIGEMLPKSSGIYVFKVSGDGLNENIKIVLQ